MKIATIDIGTNTVLLLIAQFGNGKIETLAAEQRTPRIGKNIDADGVIGKPAFDRVVDVLEGYKQKIKKFKVENIVVFGTSALRDAVNKDEFLEYIKTQTGWDSEILTGEQEAYWSYRGAVSGIRDEGNIAVIDIGGGSTEISEGTLTEAKCGHSLNIGAVRITERFFLNSPPTESEIGIAVDFINTALNKINKCQFEYSKLVGVSGTPTTLAAIHQGLKEFNADKISGYNLTFEEIDAIFRKFCKMRTEEIQELSQAVEGRADIITAGTLILLEFMKFGQIKELTVSERGVRYGIAIREWEKTK